MCVNVKTPDYVAYVLHPHLVESTFNTWATHFHHVMRISQIKAILHIKNQCCGHQPVNNDPIKLSHVKYSLVPP